MTKKETVIVLFSITLCWSSSYIFIKDLSSAFNAYAYLTLTSGVAGIVLAVLFHRLLKKMDKKTLISGSVLALLIAGNILFEKMALPASKKTKKGYSTSAEVLEKLAMDYFAYL